MARFCKCGKLATAHSFRCKSCTPKANAPTAKRDGSRIYDWQWQQMSVAYRTDNPLCQRCEAHDRVTPATSVHHIKAIKTHPELKYEWSNLMSVCEPCHHKLDAQIESMAVF